MVFNSTAAAAMAVDDDDEDQKIELVSTFCVACFI